MTDDQLIQIAEALDLKPDLTRLVIGALTGINEWVMCGDEQRDNNPVQAADHLMAHVAEKISEAATNLFRNNVHP